MSAFTCMLLYISICLAFIWFPTEHSSLIFVSHWVYCLLDCLSSFHSETKMALASILGMFLVYLLKFTLLTPFVHTFSSLSYSLAPTPVYWYTIWGYWNFRLEFVMPCTPQHTRDVPNLSYEYDCDLITGFPFALVFTCTCTECVT